MSKDGEDEVPEAVAIGGVFDGRLVTPMHDYVMVVPVGWENTSGLVIPDGVQQSTRPLRGHVVGVGPGRAPDNTKMRVKVGDMVLYGPTPKIEFHKGSAGFLLMREAEIYAIIEDVEVPTTVDEILS